MPLFLQRGGRGGVGSFMGFAREAEVYRALEPLGIPIPHVWGVDEDLDVFLVDRADGQVWFRPPRDPDVAVGGRAGLHAPARHLARDAGARARPAELRSDPFRAGAPARPIGRHQRRCSSARTASSRSTCSRRAQLEHLLASRARLRRRAGPGAGRHRSRQLHVRRRTGHRDRRLGARARRRSDGRHRVAVVAGDAAGLARLPDPPPRVRSRERHRRRRGAGAVLPPERVRAARPAVRSRRHGGGDDPSARPCGRRRCGGRPVRRRQRDGHEHAPPADAPHRAGRRHGDRASGARGARRGATAAARGAVRRGARAAARHRRSGRRSRGVQPRQGRRRVR